MTLPLRCTAPMTDILTSCDLRDMDCVAGHVGGRFSPLEPLVMGLSQQDAGHILSGLGVDNHEIYPMSHPVPQILKGSQV